VRRTCSLARGAGDAAAAQVATESVIFLKDIRTSKPRGQRRRRSYGFRKAHLAGYTANGIDLDAGRDRRPFRVEGEIDRVPIQPG
jgi:hypothetical protein